MDNTPQQSRGQIAQVELILAAMNKHPAGLLQEQSEIGPGVRGAEVSHDPAAPIDVLSDLYSSGTRGRPYPSHPRPPPRA